MLIVVALVVAVLTFAACTGPHSAAPSATPAVTTPASDGDVTTAPTADPSSGRGPAQFVADARGYGLDGRPTDAALLSVLSIPHLCDRINAGGANDPGVDGAIREKIASYGGTSTDAIDVANAAWADVCSAQDF